MTKDQQLIFVYNANSGKWNGYMDIMHKILSPQTYACNLCAITYDTFSINKDWAAFKEKTPVKMSFLHKDEWEEQYNRKDGLPAIFLEEKGSISVWIDPETMNRLSLNQLKELISEKFGIEMSE
ncbi:hypothetical protein JKA74_03555 [Marivirga sp. S37H4]|uniref:GTPase n=1 Tax=Marivirga aurantiaca TaxID=2802615 RepID=A0A935C721_9BACT|nr:hypothetical protein [Marivirga aurantiaca]MBK6264102.1 hypothetical protein [Marivirga aurantiaca]